MVFSGCSCLQKNISHSTVVAATAAIRPCIRGLHRRHNRSNTASIEGAVKSAPTSNGTSAVSHPLHPHATSAEGKKKHKRLVRLNRILYRICAAVPPLGLSFLGFDLSVTLQLAGIPVRDIFSSPLDHGKLCFEHGIFVSSSLLKLVISQLLGNPGCACVASTAAASLKTDCPAPISTLGHKVYLALLPRCIHLLHSSACRRNIGHHYCRNHSNVFAPQLISLYGTHCNTCATTTLLNK